MWKDRIKKKTEDKFIDKLREADDVPSLMAAIFRDVNQRLPTASEMEEFSDVLRESNSMLEIRDKMFQMGNKSIKKAITNLKVNDDFRQKVEDALEDLIDDLARTPECIKNAKEEGDSLKQYIDPNFMALDAINEVSTKMIKDNIDRVSEMEAEARFDL